MNLIRNMEKVSICNKKWSNRRISLENGIMNLNWVRRIEINKFLKKISAKCRYIMGTERELSRKCLEQQNGKGLSKQLTRYWGYYRASWLNGETEFFYCVPYVIIHTVFDSTKHSWRLYSTNSRKKGKQNRYIKA